MGSLTSVTPVVRCRTPSCCDAALTGDRRVSLRVPDAGACEKGEVDSLAVLVKVVRIRLPSLRKERALVTQRKAAGTKQNE